MSLQSAPASSLLCKLLFQTCLSWCDKQKSYHAQWKKMIDACLYLISVFANCTGIQRGLLGGACLGCVCCVKSLVWREGAHIGLLSSLRASSCAHLASS